MKIKTELKDKKGFLTKYGLACGYIEKTDKKGIETTLWQEHNVYHIRQHDFNNHIRIFWDSFNTFSKAKKRYLQAIRG